MKTIWKFPLEATDQQMLALPKGARILTVQLQHGRPCIWAVVDPTAEKEGVEIRTHGTGHDLPPDAHSYEHIGTYQLEGGALVFHVFRLKEMAEMLREMFR